MVKLNLPKQRTTIGPANPLKRVGAFLIDFIILEIVVISSFKDYFLRLMPASAARSSTG